MEAFVDPERQAAQGGPGEHQDRHLLGPRGRPPEHVAHDDLDRDAGQHERRGGDQAGPQQPGDGADDAPETLDRRVRPRDSVAIAYLTCASTSSMMSGPIETLNCS